MGITLTSKTVSSTYDSLLKLSDNDQLTGAFKLITDGLGTDTGISINDSGDVNISGTLVVGERVNTPILQLTGGTGTQGTFSWNTDEWTVDLIQNGTTLQLGQEVQIHVKNQTGSTIPDGTPVYATGTVGASGRITVAPMIANGSVDAKYFLGITTEDIADGGDGKITTFGKIRGLNTSAYTEGQTLWVSSTVAGGFQTTRPVAPNLDLEVAIVINSHVNNGTIFVRANNGHYLGTAHDVNISSVAENDLLVYKTNRWVNTKSIGDLSAANVTLSGYLRGPATFVIDPAEHGDERGLVQILGDLRVDGTTTTINSTTISVSDKNITLAKDAATAGDANGAGITIAGASATLTYLSATDDFTFNKNVNASRFVGPLTGNVTGTVSTLSNHDTDDLDEGLTNLYFTTTRARDSFSAGTGVAINAGEISIGQSVGTTDNVTFGVVTASLSGNATTASALATARNIALDGSVTGNADFDGSGNITITTTTNHNHDDRYYTETEVGNFFSGTTAITGYNKTNWDGAYDYSQIGHLELTGGTLTGDLTLDDKLTITGTTNNLVIDEEADGTWHLYDTFQSNGIVLHSGSGGMELQYNGVTELTIDGSGVSFTGTINLDAADLNIGAADIIFDTTSGGAVRGLIWNVAGEGFLSKITSGGIDSGKVTIYTNIGTTTVGSTFEIYGANGLGLSLSNSGILTAGGGTSTQWNTAYNYSQVGHLPLAGGTLTGGLIITGDLSGATDIYVDDKIISTGDNNTYMQFSAADTWRVVTGGSQRLKIDTLSVSINNANLTVSGTISASGYNNTDWDAAYTYSQVGHLPLSGGTVVGNITATEFYGGGANITGVNATLLDGINSSSFLRSDASDTMTGDLTVNGNVIVNSNNGTQAFYVGRYDATNQALKIWTDDSTSYFESIQDENTGAYGSFSFALDAGGATNFLAVTDGVGGTNLFSVGKSAVTIPTSISLGQSTNTAAASLSQYTNGYVYLRGGSGGAAVVDTTSNYGLYVTEGTSVKLVTNNGDRLVANSNSVQILGNLTLTNSPAYITADGGDLYIDTEAVAGRHIIMQSISGQNVGIGYEPNAAYRLDVGGKIRATDDLVLWQTNPRIDYDSGNTGSLRFVSTYAGSVTATLLSNGYFGLNETNPAYRLTVNGTGNFTDELGATVFRSNAIGAATTSTSGWHKIGRINSRGGGVITLSFTGGSYSPVTYKINYYKNWTDVGTLKLEKYGSSGYISTARIRLDDADGLYYVEIYAVQATSFNVYHDKLLGYNATGIVYTGALAAGSTSGTTISELPFVSYGTSVTTLYSGSIGIGEGSPSAKLHITNTSGDADLILQGSSQTLRIDQNSIRTQTTSPLNIFTNNTSGTNSLYIENDGRFGIGTTAPTAGTKLDVAGTGRFNGNVALITDASSGNYSVIQHNYNGVAKAYSGYNSGLAVYGGEAEIPTYIQAGGGYAMVLLANGNVGIGTTNPQRQFVVSDGGANGVEIDSNQGGVSEIISYNRSTGAYTSMYIIGNEMRYYGNEHNWYSTTGNSFLMRLKSNGLLGLGTSDPQTHLHVSSAAHTKLRVATTGVADASVEIHGYDAGLHIGDPTNGNRWAIWNDGVSTSSSLKIGSYALGTWYNDSSQAVTITSTGLVGIGTTSPAYKLDVNGNARIVSGLQMISQNSDLYAQDGALSYYSTTNGVYLNGAGTNGWLRLNAAGTENNINAINIFGAGAGGYIDVRTAGNSRIFVTNGGSVGIGTTSPSEKLQVAGSAAIINVNSTSAGANANVHFQTTARKWGIGPNMALSNSYFEIYDYTAGQNRLIVDDSGNFAINRTSAEAKLDVNGNSLFRVGGGATNTGDFTIANDGCSRTVASWSLDSTPIFFINSENTDTPHIGMNMSTATANGPKIIGYKSRGSAAANSSVANGDEILSIEAWPLHTAGPNYYKFGGGMTWYKDDGGGTANTYAPVSLKWVMSNSVTTTITAMTLTYNGNLSTYGTITAGGDVYAYSDARVKENVETIDNALDKVMSMRGVSYNRTDNDDKTKKVGVIAQEIQKILPEVVSEQEDGMLSVSYGNIVGVLIEAIKEQQKQIDELKSLLDVRTK